MQASMELTRIHLPFSTVNPATGEPIEMFTYFTTRKQKPRLLTLTRPSKAIGS
jgi:hypothetical protein